MYISPTEWSDSSFFFSSLFLLDIRVRYNYDALSKTCLSIDANKDIFPDENVCTRAQPSEYPNLLTDFFLSRLRIIFESAIIIRSERKE